MASPPGRSTGRYTYTLNDFGRDFDRRPMVFLEQFPASRLCSLCGVVPERTALLPCRDVVCQRCYDKCQIIGGCPLHPAIRIYPNDIEWRVMKGAEVSKKKVLCWNAKNGCPVETEACKMAEHCYSACEYYNVVCTRCRKKVLHKDVVQHLKDSCSSNILIQTSENVPDDGPGDNAYGSFEEVRGGAGPSAGSDDATTELLRLNRRILNELHSIREQLPEERKCCEGVMIQCLDATKLEVLSAMKDHATEANNWHNGTYSCFKDDVSEMTSQLGKKMDAVMEETTESLQRLQDDVNRETSRLMKVATKTLEFASSVSNFQEWVVRGWAALKDRATTHGEAWYHEKPLYFHGYHLSPGLLLVRKDGEEGVLKVHLVIELKEGTNDEYLEWPFRRCCRVTFIHPRVRPRARSLTLMPELEAFADSLVRPNGETTPTGPVYSAGNFCHAHDLEKEGYVSADEIRVRFELMF
ncbi:hypothetical protein HPB51_023982 [Rhipicephalus microplus]|uniref:TRAF1-6 MATH domain-containing protein n=1 Tax=Rhipicephalus microplus TaxID=6941 RepID=A0A9J6EDP1_RHIMP|nr:uncharacterized protein LOC119164263 [Rhipicephalus microplus]KAH8032205.1 hypothetical protein HPB51_023982 [Rhipicephalus microplus]